MAWRQLHLSAQQHKQILTIPTSTPQITSQIDNGSSSLLSLQDVMLKHQQRFEKRRLSENDLDRDIREKLPKLSPIENNTCTSALPLSLTGMSLISSGAMTNTFTSDKPFNALMSHHREKSQNQQYLERLRRMNERSHCKERGSRVNYDPNSPQAKTVREELMNRKLRSKNGKFLWIALLRSLWFRFRAIFHLLMATTIFHHHSFPKRDEVGWHWQFRHDSRPRSDSNTFNVAFLST